MTPQQLEWGLNAVTGLVVVSVALALASLTWRLAGEPGGRARAAVAAAAAVSAPVPVDLTPILLAAPFGSPAVLQPALGQGEGLGLQLRGILRTRRASASTALVATSDGKVQSVAVGQSVGSATVESIEIDHVVLNLGGRRERLGFPERSVASAAGVASIRALIPDAVAGVPAPAARLGVAPPAVAPGSASPVEVYRERMAASPQTLLGTLGASATPQGYRVGATPSPDMQRAGLAPGDVVTTINGSPVGDVERDRQLFEQAVASGRARVEVIRDGRRIVLSFPLR